MASKYPTDPTVIAEIQKLRIELKLTNKGLAAMLLMDGVNETFLSKYTNDKLDRQVENFEARFRDTLRGIRDRIEFGSEVFETSVTRKMRNAFDLVRRTGDIGLFTSPAGNGKTSGINSYWRDNPSAVRVSLNAATRSADQLLGVIFSQLDSDLWKPNTSRYSYTVGLLRTVSRFLILDNAQRLDNSGRQLLFDLHDEANCPIALIGNPETLGRIRANDQQFSRIGIHGNYELEAKELPAAAKRVAHQFSDLATAEAIEDLTAVIASHEGRLRAVKKTVILAQELRLASAALRDDPRAAIRSAHSRLVRDYALPSD